jgi:hypothetical protein
MADYVYKNKLIQVTVDHNESFIEKFNKMTTSGSATEGSYTYFEVENVNLFIFTMNNKKYYVYEELIANENGLTSNLYFSESEISNFKDMILESKKCLPIFETNRPMH